MFSDFSSFNQYLVSRASLEAIDIFVIKSLFDCATEASSTFAPILVPHLNSCFDNSNFLRSTSALFNRRISQANR